MLNHSTRLTASAFAIGAAALLIAAPIAYAEDPAPCDPTVDQQCENQDQGQQIAGEVIDQVQQGVDQAKGATDDLQSKKPNPDGPYTGLYVLLNGVPTCMPFGVPVSALDRVEPVPGYPNHGRC
jgi:hypothetical protein